MPLVPILPAIGIFFNFMLAAGLDGLTWAYFGIFLLIGLIIYFSYSMWHSKLEVETITQGKFEVSLISNLQPDNDHFDNATEYELRYQTPPA